MTNLKTLIQEIKATGFDAEDDRFFIDESLTADNGWSVEVMAEGYKNLGHGLLDPSDSRSAVAEVESITLTALSFQVYDSDDNKIVLSPEGAEKVYEAISNSIG